MKSISLFVGFTPYHSFFAKNIIDDCDGEVFCLFTKGWPKTKKPYKKLGFFNSENKCLKVSCYVLSMAFFSIRVRLLLKGSCHIHVYIPHPDNIFSNFLFFSKKISSINIYEDGILNYYDASVTPKARRSMIILAGRFLGLKYKAYKGHLAGYDARKVDRLFVSNPDAIAQRDKVGDVHKVHVDEQNLIPIERRALFLDQDTSTLLEGGKREEVLNLMFKLYPPIEWEYIYKRHHEFNSPISGMEALEAGLSGLPAEELVGYLRPQLVVSFFSSALIGIKKIYPEIICIHLAGGFLPIKINGCERKVSHMLEAAGVIPIVQNLQND